MGRLTFRHIRRVNTKLWTLKEKIIYHSSFVLLIIYSIFLTYILTKSTLISVLCMRWLVHFRLSSINMKNLWIVLSSLIPHLVVGVQADCFIYFIFLVVGLQHSLLNFMENFIHLLILAGQYEPQLSGSLLCDGVSHFITYTCFGFLQLTKWTLTLF